VVHVSLRGHRIGMLVLAGAGAFGAMAAAAEPLLGVPGPVSALGAPWLVCAFAIGAVVRGRSASAPAGGLLLSGATVAYYGAQVYGHGAESVHYALSMAVGWGVPAGVAGAVMGAAGSLWRRASGLSAALLAAVPAAALAGEAALLSRSWSGPDSALALGMELGAAAVLLVALTRERARLAHTLAGAVVLTLAFALVEAELRGYLRAAGWHGA
jgi:hypothetical protein